MNGTLLFDVATIATAPRFFSLLALVERASGKEIVLMVSSSQEAKEAAKMGIPYNRYEKIDPSHARRAAFAKSLSAPVIWVDLAFNEWQGPNVFNDDKLVTLNWRKALDTSMSTAAQEV